jgi:hypothetical protein
MICTRIGREIRAILMVTNGPVDFEIGNYRTRRQGNLKHNAILLEKSNDQEGKQQDSHQHEKEGFSEEAYRDPSGGQGADTRHH